MQRSVILGLQMRTLCMRKLNLHTVALSYMSSSPGAALTNFPLCLPRPSLTLAACQCKQARAYSSTKNSKPEVAASDDLGELIYTGTTNTFVRLVKLFSLSTSAIGICLQPWLISEMSTSSLVFKVAVVTATGFFVLGTPMLLHFLCKRYVLHMYYNKQTNTFTAYRLNFFAKPTKFSFTPDQISDNLPNPFSNFQVGKQGFLLDTDMIRESHPETYIVFMRYDEPMDLSEYQIIKPGEEKTKTDEEKTKADEEAKRQL